jgi:hypothetical protein
LVLLAAGLIAAQRAGQGRRDDPAVVDDSTAFTTGDFHDCPPEGDGLGDEDLDRRKNRDKPPPGFKPMKVADFVDNHPVLAEEMVAQRKRKRAEWTDDARASVAALENTGVSVEGFLIAWRREGKESCNCHSGADVDHHVWLGGADDDTKPESMVVEISPRLLGANPGWTEDALEQITKKKLRVRISGWPMWDQEHPDQVGKSRGTLWEIHPIHKIEVLQNGQWNDLSDGL